MEVSIPKTEVLHVQAQSALTPTTYEEAAEAAKQCDRGLFCTYCERPICGGPGGMQMHLNQHCKAYESHKQGYKLKELSTCEEHRISGSGIAHG